MTQKLTTLALLVLIFVTLLLVSCVSYTVPLGDDSRYGSVTLSARYNPPMLSLETILGFNRNIQGTLKDK